MDFLGIGPLELIFILIIALIIFGPNDIVRAGKTLGRFMRKVVSSDGWRAFQQASKGMRDIPTTLMREAGLEEEDLRRLSGVNDLEQATKGLENQISPWTTPPTNTPTDLSNSAGAPISDEPEQPKMTSPSEEREVETPPEEPAQPPPGSPFSQPIEDEN
jgi:Sec-independent protein translocase protein TatA